MLRYDAETNKDQVIRDKNLIMTKQLSNLKQESRVDVMSV